jgi:hypothetical protein
LFCVDLVDETWERGIANVIEVYLLIDTVPI